MKHPGVVIINLYRNSPLHGKLGSDGASTRALAQIAGGMSPWLALWANGRPVLSLSDRRAGKSWTGHTPPGQH